MNHQSPLPSDTRDDRDGLEAAARAYLPDATEIATIAGHPDIVRVSAPSGIWGVRQLPEGTPITDVAFSHRVMEAALEAGLVTVPAILPPPEAPEETALRLGTRLYDARRWMPGEPPRRSDAAWPEPDDRIDIPVVLRGEPFSTVIASLARLHEATVSLADTPNAPEAPLRLLPGAVRQAHGRHLGALRPRARYEPSIQRWLATSERLLAAAEPMVLAATRETPLPSSVLHLGLWPAHVLLDEGKVSGLLGWERVAAGSPLLDLAQAILRLQGWTDDAVEVALGVYGESQELAPQQRRLLPAVAALDAVATTGRLLEQTFTTATTARPPTVLKGAIDMMLDSMAALDRNLNAPSDKSRRRVWNRQRPSPGRARGGKPREPKR